MATPTIDVPRRSSNKQSDKAQLATLFERWQRDRDAAAREQLVQRFMPLARKLARRYVGANEPFEDLLQVSNLGLLLAIDRFDFTRGTAFTSFAVPTILGELRRYFRDLGWAVHVPRAAQEKALKVESLSKELAAKNGRPPSMQQLAQVLEWPLEDVMMAMEAGNGHHASSLQAPHDSDDGEHGEMLDGFGEIDDGYELVNDRMTVSEAARRLPMQERRVLHMRFIGEMTQSEIGNELGVSQMQISRLLRQSISKLRKMADVED